MNNIKVTVEMLQRSGPNKKVMQFWATRDQLPAVQDFVKLPDFCPTRVHQYTWHFAGGGLVEVCMQVNEMLHEKIMVSDSTAK